MLFFFFESIEYCPVWGVPNIFVLQDLFSPCRRLSHQKGPSGGIPVVWHHFHVLCQFWLWVQRYIRRLSVFSLKTSSQRMTDKNGTEIDTWKRSGHIWMCLTVPGTSHKQMLLTVITVFITNVDSSWRSMCSHKGRECIHQLEDAHAWKLREGR